MARIVKTETKEKVSFKIINQYKDGTSNSVILSVGDLATNLCYVDDKTTKKVSGKIVDIDIDFLSATNKSGSVKSFLTNDAKVVSITVDSSTENNSVLTKINAKEILEYGNDAEKEIERVVVLPYVSINAKSTLSDETVSEMDISEGEHFNNMILQEHGKEIELDGQITSFYYNLIPGTTDVKFIGFNVRGDVIRSVLFKNVKSFGTLSKVVEEGKTINEALAEIAESTYGGIILPKGRFEDNVDITSSAAINGNNFGIAANKDIRAKNEIDNNETVVAGTVNISVGADVTLDGLTFTENAHIVVGGAASLKIRNCKFTNATSYQEKSFLIYDQKDLGDGILIDIQNCYFGDNGDGDKSTIYNGFELWGKIKDGSIIANNYFTKKSVRHNNINFYGCEDNSKITVENNFFEYSANAIRLGFVGSPVVVVDINNNTYKETDPYNNYEYAGLLLIQPCAKATTSFGGMIVNLTDNTMPKSSTQIAYIYCGSDDTQLEGETLPKVTKNKRSINLPRLS